MSRPAAPSLPTPKQIREVRDLVSSLDPRAKILRIGPDGVTFSYEDESVTQSWEGTPFSAENKDE